MMSIEINTSEKCCSQTAAVLCPQNSYLLLYTATFIGESKIK